ncbi:hypothetical protein OSB04_008037 [Centaurea solstitialis]|uniref:Uncharacterized protein n=1 Tax=Centaurea solstitialis TaxID=347529 RepID=A0AA38WJ41_9ASTR|nr:hypothetical protein OSB04_008037 [Centaurea solstitialis]
METSLERLAEQFEVENGRFREDGGRKSLVEMMKDKGGVWDEIVKEKGILGTKLEEVGGWSVVDIILSTQGVLDVMNKSKEHGYKQANDSEDTKPDPLNGPWCDSISHKVHLDREVHNQRPKFTDPENATTSLK